MSGPTPGVNLRPFSLICEAHKNAVSAKVVQQCPDCYRLLAELRCNCDAQNVPGANHVPPCVLYDAEEDAAIQRERAGRLVGANLRLERRVAELEAALRKIADHPNWFTDNGTTDLCDASCVEHIMALAKQAVEKVKQT